VLLARFDADALRPPPAASVQTDPRDRAVHAALAAWCREGLDVPFAVGVVVHADAARATRLAAALARDLDGSDRLDALSPLAGRVWRVRIKLAEALPSRVARPDDVWDAGYLIDTPAGSAALARFAPRRPTLVIADGADDIRCAEALETLQERSARFGRPVRFLALDRPEATPALPPTARVFTLGGD
jgi:hypothetical protein